MKLADLPDVLTADQAAEVLQVSTWSVYDLVKRDQLRALRVGRLVRLPKSELVRFIACDLESEEAGPKAGDLNMTSSIATLATKTPT